MTEDPRHTFSRSAGKYLLSADHQTGPDLTLIRDTAAELLPAVCLDVAAGAGHALLAAAPFSGQCLASDLTFEMLAVTRGHLSTAGVARVSCLQASADALPVKDGTVDLLTCRIAAHHFPSVPGFLDETARVLMPGGTAVIIDSIVPEDPAADVWLNTAEACRDPSHVRSHRMSAWTAFIRDSGLKLIEIQVFGRRHRFGEWARRVIDEEDRVAALESRFLKAPPAIVDTYRIEVESGRVVAYTDQKGIFVVKKAREDGSSEEG